MSVELLTTDEMSRADRLTIESGTPGLVLMENAGRAVAEEAANRFAKAKNITVLCGPGNNGGDGFVAARLLKEKALNIRLALLGEQERLRGDAAEMAKRWDGQIEAFEKNVIDEADIVIDAIFGAGLTRPIKGLAAQMIETVQAKNVPVIAVDIPSGVDGNSGAIRGTAMDAVSTVTFFRRKPGHVLFPGRERCGKVITVDIGIVENVLESITPKTFVNALVLWHAAFPWPSFTGHKYNRGHALIVSGPMTQTGAARLGARGALRAGAGLVTVASPREALSVNASHLTTIMLLPCDGSEELTRILEDKRKSTVLIGPGCGVTEETYENVLAALGTSASVVLDADALTVFEGKTDTFFRAIKSHQASVVLTPHEGEFRRLFDFREDDLSKLERARKAAKLSGACIILKGSDTIIAMPDGRAAINENAPPWLATAGSGDVLAGIVTGLLAQSMPVFEAASAAVWLHGAAAAEFGRGLIAEDLAEQLPYVLQDL